MYLSVSNKSCLEKNLAPDSSSVRYGKGMVLIVDDDALIIEIEKKMLTALGYEVMVAESGEEALELYDTHGDKIDLVLLDMVMPGLSGGETYDRLKEIDDNVKVLISSGYKLNETIEEILNRGCGGYIQKPFSLNDLSVKVKQTLDIENSKSFAYK